MVVGGANLPSRIADGISMTVARLNIQKLQIGAWLGVGLGLG